MGIFLIKFLFLIILSKSMHFVFIFCISILLFHDSYSGTGFPNRLESSGLSHPAGSLTNSKNHLCGAIPDYFQQDTSFGGFTNGGKMYCAPVSVSNSIVSLFGSFLFRTASDSQITSKKNQYFMIKTLASPEYIATSRFGSGPAEICKGVQKFLLDNNIRNFSISHYGWRPVPSQFQKERFPDLTVLPDHLKSKQNAIWLNIGWYNHNINSNSYYRTGGHWVTLAALPVENKNCIIIHDPATLEDRCENILLTTLQKGTLNGNMNGLPLPAEGFSCFRNKSGNYGIIDGFIILEINPEFALKK